MSTPPLPDGGLAVTIDGDERVVLKRDGVVIAEIQSTRGRATLRVRADKAVRIEREPAK